MSFLPPSLTLEDQLLNASQDADENNWHELQAGLLIRLDIPMQVELALRKCVNAETFKTVSVEQNRLLSSKASHG